jgi:hypothetical protein
MVVIIIVCFLLKFCSYNVRDTSVWNRALEWAERQFPEW